MNGNGTQREGKGGERARAIGGGGRKIDWKSDKKKDKPQLSGRERGKNGEHYK